ncbi:MAG: helix-turn-helix transcriptional regulator [Actinobacteria bacterium]|nr:helix-turn-helix transcriptional regulator [Actinomycetota bacterium]
MKAQGYVREARRRAGLTQRELATLVGTTQSALARIESGATEPSLARVAALIRACGFDLRPTIAVIDDDDWSLAADNLRLDLDARVRTHQAAVRFVEAGRRALADARA